MLGAFAPMVRMPIMGSMNYFQNGRGDGVFIVILGTLSALLIAAKWFKGLWFTGLASAGLLIYAYTTFQGKLAQIREEATRDLAGNPFGGMAEAMVRSVQLDWGFAVMAIGALLLLIAAGIPERGGRAR
jgi:hypothetical protein